MEAHMQTRLFGLLALMCLLFIVVGCDGGLFPPAPTPTPVPPVTSLPRATPVLPSAAQPATSQSNFSSGGLGLSQADWERQHGAPNKGGADQGMANYEQNKYIVLFYGGDTVQDISRQ